MKRMVSGSITVEAFFFNKKQLENYVRKTQKMLKNEFSIEYKIIGKKVEDKSAFVIAIHGETQNTTEEIKQWFWGVCKALPVGLATLTILGEFENFVIINEKRVMLDWAYLDYLTSIFEKG